jgi:hypothetical protein
VSALRLTVSYLRHGILASTADGIRKTHADGRAARQRARTRTPNATAAGICAASFVLGSVAGLLLYFIAVPHQKQ